MVMAWRLVVRTSVVHSGLVAPEQQLVDQLRHNSSQWCLFCAVPHHRQLVTVNWVPLMVVGAGKMAFRLKPCLRLKKKIDD